MTYHGLTGSIPPWTNDGDLSGHPRPANENEARDVDFGVGGVAFVDMSNVLNEATKQQVIAWGRLGWPLRHIEQETGVRRETVGAYLKAAGIGVRPPGAWGRRPPAKPANDSQVTPGSDAAKPTPNDQPPTINPHDQPQPQPRKPF
jgi:hypothetical protein